MNINLPYKVRAGLYILITLGTPVIGYLLIKGIISEIEVSLWGGLVMAVSAMATFNTQPNEEEL